MNLIQNYYYTIINLRPRQILYQIWYRLKKFVRNTLHLKYKVYNQANGEPVLLKPFPDKPVSLTDNRFTFLNQTTDYNELYQYPGMTRLWCYNVNYMDFLLQPGMEGDTGLVLIKSYINSLPHNKIGIEPYPIALRGINWIKFFSLGQTGKSRITDHILQMKIDASLFAQYEILLNNIEYHLLGNHLLEDGFSLLFGAFYFNNPRFYKKALSIIKLELIEQIIEDGAHFELSPMYHQIMLDRILDCMNLLQNNWRFNNQDELLGIMREKASLMLGWLLQITFKNGDIPMVNDSAAGMAPMTSELLEYAERLGIVPNMQKLSVCGYRMFRREKFELFVDYGVPGPDYIPGHSHSDLFSFIMHVNGKTLICDTGTSTYEKGIKRDIERSTRAHNTVSVNGMEQSEVWGAFRMGRRTKPVLKNESESFITGYHCGFKPFIHTRDFSIGEKKIKIRDEISHNKYESKAYFHFVPGIRPHIEKNRINLGIVEIIFRGADSIREQTYDFCTGFNKREVAYMIVVGFKNSLLTEIEI